MLKTGQKILSISLIMTKQRLSYHDKIKRTPKPPNSSQIFENQSKVFQKLVSQGERKKKTKKFYESSDTIPTSNLQAISNQKSGRRQIVLESLFMNHITNMLANDEIGGNLNDYSLEITNVKVSSNYTNINVWWKTNDSINLRTIAKILDDNSPKIRAILTSRNIIGKVPQIQFVLDKETTKLIELENALSKADFGPDFVREETTTPAIKPPNQNQSLESLVNQQFKDMKNTIKVPSWKSEYNIPVNMKQDTLGLDYFQMMDVVLLKKNKKEVLAASSRNDRTDLKEKWKEISKPAYQSLDLKQFIKNRRLKQKEKCRKTMIDKEMSNIVIEETSEDGETFINEFEDDYIDETEIK